MPTHILVECPEYIVSASLGVVASLRPMEERGLLQTRFVRTMDICKKDICWADVLITVRGCEPFTVKIVEQCRKAGRLVVYYLDDDLLHIPHESLARDYYDDPVIREGMKKCLNLADVLWGVNPNIRERYLPLTSGRWVENKVAKAPAKPWQETDDNGPIKILYAGSTDHIVLVRELLAPAAKRLCETFGEKIDITFIGVDPGLWESDAIHYIPYIRPYEAYCDFVESGNFRIGLAPGRTNDFFACKYYNKYLEYSAIGAVGVYTNAEPYTQIVTDGINGVLCDNTAEAWCKAVERLINDPELLRSCAENSRRILEERFNTETVTNELLAQCPELSEYRAPEISPQKIHIGHPFLVFYWGRTTLLWRQRGLLALPEIAFRCTKILLMTLVKGFRRLVQNVFRGNKEK